MHRDRRRFENVETLEKRLVSHDRVAKKNSGDYESV